MIDNPEYIGEWAPRKIANPAFFEDLDPVKSLEKIVSPEGQLIPVSDVQIYRVVSVLNCGQ